MTRPTIPVTLPKDSDPIGEGAQRIRETRQALYDIFPIKKEDLDPGMTPEGTVSKEYVDERDQLLQDQIDSNKGNIESNETNIENNAGNIAANAMEIATNSGLISTNADNIAINAGNILTNSGDIADLDVRVTKNEGDIAALEASIPEAGIKLDNSQPWTHAQYNTLIDATISNNGTSAPRSTLDLQDNPNIKVSPSSGGSITFCTIFSDNITMDGIYSNILLDPVATYTFDSNKFEVPDVDESKWMYVRLLSDGGKWYQVGSNYLGEAGGLGGGSDVYTEHLNATVEDTTIVSTNNALSAGPVQLDNVVTVESGATWVIV